MKTRYKYYKNIFQFCFLFCCIVILNLTSCTKEWLDKKPDIKTTIPASLQDCQALLDYNTLFNGDSPGLGEIASDGHFVIESRILTMADNSRNAYTWSNELPYRNVSDWISQPNLGSYTRIFTCNLILETLEKITLNNLNQSLWNNIKGQALFQRARSFYELAQLYAPPYQLNSENNSLCIPLRLTSDINILSVRSTVKETYELVINDLKLAQELLPITPSYKTRASKPGAFALLARVYLSMEDYTNAGICANGALEINSVLLDYNTLIISDPFPVKQLNTEVIFHSSLVNYGENGTGLRIDPQLISLYQSNDLRIPVFFSLSAGQYSFKGSYTGSRQCFNGLANDEMYLIRAESRARAGSFNEAMADVNTLLKNRWKKVGGISTYVDQSATNQSQALEIVLQERKKELLLRGLRWSDMRRLNKDPRFAVSLSRTVQGKIYTLEPNSFRYVFPLPIDVIEMSNMSQNPGWNN
ncbi:RagB/SusD family nutrient uptake outer membrane protein [Pedobacter ginsengisoli]|uniref:RagB/SusD family nutrient uptake outer membrane protein n=1 Tax=Pedobacter ginsengisoli TaxID=363852 RepID=UPI00254E6095|nr:RagB/SusD family nutrient uptake outer membrane protein [Pedobacter ginsengisoli]